MALWCRFKPTKIKTFSNLFKRCYFQFLGSSLLNHSAASTARAWIPHQPTLFIRQSDLEFATGVRFFAGKSKSKPKPKSKSEEEERRKPRLNGQITADHVRLVTDTGHDIMRLQEALNYAKSLNLDLVEVQRNVNPPVCKIMDFSRTKFELQAKEKAKRKEKKEVTLRNGESKEVRFSIKTEQKDLEMKANTVKRLMERGYRVKCMAMGTEEQPSKKRTEEEELALIKKREQELGALLSCLCKLIEDVSVVESGPRMEKRQAYVIVRHVKFGPSKKSGKKASKVSVSTDPEAQKVVTTLPLSTLIQDPIHPEEIVDSAESGLETEDEILSEEEDMSDGDLDQEKNWSVSDANDDFDSVFDVGDDAMVAKDSRDVQWKMAPHVVPSPTNIFPDFMRPRPVVDSTKTVRSYPSDFPPVAENRYRMDPKMVYSPTKPIDGKGIGGTDSTRFAPQFPNQFRQPQFILKDSPPTRVTNQVASDASPNLKSPTMDIPGQQSNPHAPGSPPCSRGIFSATKVNDTSEKGGTPAEFNMYQKGNTFGSTRHPRPLQGVSSYPKSPDRS